ncbi:MAG TPA: hypothetical protein VM620_06635, partial [Hyphomicrobium sp.]|nr:hypothetical protein [Hyphomicrobium sp.]
ERKDTDTDHERAGTLLPASETTAHPGTTAEILAPKTQEVAEETPEQEQARVFAKLKGMTSPKEEEPEEEKEPEAEPEEKVEEENKDQDKSA